MKKTLTIVGRGNHTEVVEKENTEVEQPHGGGGKDHTEMVESTTQGWRERPLLRWRLGNLNHLTKSYLFIDAIHFIKKIKYNNNK